MTPSRTPGMVTLVLLTVALLHATAVHASPIQYCKATSAYNFCMALESFANATSGENDVYITFVTTRETAHARGWNAFGFGDRMDGALMFVMYGDPADKEGRPTLSVRTTTEHNQPTVLEINPATGHHPDIRVANTEFLTQLTSPAVTLTAHVICYACDRWTARPSSQPYQSFIWAANTEQEFNKKFTATAELEYHTPGRGFFYGNMDQSLSTNGAQASPASANEEGSVFLHPEIDVTTLTTSLKPSTNIGTQEDPPAGLASSSSTADTSPAKTFKSQLFLLHGLLVSLSFLILFPLGAIAMRTPQRLLPFPAFKIHFGLQLLGTVIALLGMSLALILSRHWFRWHQAIGILIFCGILTQGYLGWKHHVNYLRTKTRTPILSDAHVWLGRLLLMAGWGELVLGLIWAKWRSLFVLGMMGIVMVEGGAVFFADSVVLFVHRYVLLHDRWTSTGGNRRGGSIARHAREWDLDDEAEGLAVLEEVSDEDGDNDGEPPMYSSEAFGGMQATGLMAGIPAKGLEEAEDEDRERARWIPGSSGPSR